MDNRWVWYRFTFGDPRLVEGFWELLIKVADLTEGTGRFHFIGPYPIRVSPTVVPTSYYYDLRFTSSSEDILEVVSREVEASVNFELIDDGTQFYDNYTSRFPQVGSFDLYMRCFDAYCRYQLRTETNCTGLEEIFHLFCFNTGLEDLYLIILFLTGWLRTISRDKRYPGFLRFTCFLFLKSVEFFHWFLRRFLSFGSFRVKDWKWLVWAHSDNLIEELRRIRDR